MSDTVRFGRADDTVWPVPYPESEHALRYGGDFHHLHTAAVLAAYAHLTDPTISQRAAFEDGEIGYLAINEPDRHGNFHVVTENLDGTISVGGSIAGREFFSQQVSGAGPIASKGGWHGWLERGVWRSA